MVRCYGAGQLEVRVTRPGKCGRGEGGQMEATAMRQAR